MKDVAETLVSSADALGEPLAFNSKGERLDALAQLEQKAKGQALDKALRALFETKKAR